MKKFEVSGMSCAACSARVEKEVAKVEGVDSCNVNLIANLLTVEGEVEDEQVISAVQKAGYSAVSTDTNTFISKNKPISPKNEKGTVNEIAIRLILSVVLTLALTYCSMGYNMWGFPLPDFFVGNAFAVGLLQLLLSLAVIIINKRFFINGVKGILNKAPNMDTLVALGSAVSFIYSVVVLFIMSKAAAVGDFLVANQYLHNLYFESAAMILTLITIGKLLESISKGKTTNAIKGLMALSPDTANLLINDVEQIVQVNQVKAGDIFVVRPGERIPVDGVIIEGNSTVDESALSGESVPLDKDVNDMVYAATINQAGYIKVRAVKVGQDTTLAKIIQMVTDAQGSKAPISRLADKVSGIFVPIVLGIALITVFVWLIIGESAGFCLSRGVAVLVISCPCALGLATPVAIMVGSGVGSRNGILFKNAIALEQAGKTKIVALDKTGTITQGKPSLTDIIPYDVNEQQLLSIAYSLESKSEHPLAKAIVEYAQKVNAKLLPTEDFLAVFGSGIKATIQDKQYFLGNQTFISQQLQLSENILDSADKLSNEGKTPLFICQESTLLGIIAVADTLKSDVQAIEILKKMGLRVIMLTGDNPLTAKAIAKQASIDEVYSQLMPNDKKLIIDELKTQGFVTMVGDGINDAPSLTAADVGIAVAKGTDVAMDAADIVLMNDKLTDVVLCIKLSKRVYRGIVQNLFWAFFYNLISIPLAAGVFTALLNWQLSPMVGAAAMSLSSLCVVLNSLRLNLFNKKIKAKEKTKMEKTLKIKGMMCAHCEARVRKSLEAVVNVTDVEVSYLRGEAHVCFIGRVAVNTLIDAVEKQGYEVIEVL